MDSGDGLSFLDLATTGLFGEDLATIQERSTASGSNLWLQGGRWLVHFAQAGETGKFLFLLWWFHFV